MCRRSTATPLAARVVAASTAQATQLERYDKKRDMVTSRQPSKLPISTRHHWLRPRACRLEVRFDATVYRDDLDAFHCTAHPPQRCTVHTLSDDSHELHEEHTLDSATNRRGPSICRALRGQGGRPGCRTIRRLCEPKTTLGSAPCAAPERTTRVLVGPPGEYRISRVSS